MTTSTAIDNIRSLFNQYQEFLATSDWFKNLAVVHRDPCTYTLNLLSAAIDTDSAARMWEAVVDHWHEIGWEVLDGPDVWEDLYDAIDDYRLELGVDSTESA